MRTRLSALAISYLEVVRVVHDAEYVAKRIDDRCRDEALTAIPWRFDRLRTVFQQALICRGHIVDMPVHHHATWAHLQCRGQEAPVDETQLLLVVADAKLIVGGLLLAGQGAIEIGSHAE